MSGKPQRRSAAPSVRQIDDKPYALVREKLERYRVEPLPDSNGHDLRLPEGVADFLLTRVVVRRPPAEYLGAILVDEDVRGIAYCVPYLGYLSRLKVEVMGFLAPAMVVGAAGLLLFHNRPGHDPRPTRRDVQLARGLVRTGKRLDMSVLDYLVLGDGEWTSLQKARRVRFPPPGSMPEPDGRARVKPKYRNPEDPSQTWSGRGKRARWLEEKLAAGAKLEDFAVKD